MKKMSFAFLLLPLILSLNSCSNNKVVNVTFGRLFDSSKGSASSSLYMHTDNLSYFDLNRKISNKENFVLLVYEYKTLENGGNIECTCYSSFATSLITYMQKKNAQIFAIDPSDLENKTNIFSLDVSLGEQTLAIFKDGDLVNQKKNGNETLSTYEKVSSYLDGIVSWSDMLYIDTNQLNRLSIQGKQFSVGYLRKSCSDCAYLTYNLLKDYNTKTLSKNIYVIECDDEGIRYKNGEYDEGTWQNFKDQYGLSSLHNTNFGYREGYVPSFFTYKGDGSSLYLANDVIDGAVYLNDTLELSNSTCKITSSYWDDRNHPFFSSLDSGVKTNLLNMEISTGNYEVSASNVSWKKNDARKYHDPLLEGFLNYYAK